MKLFFFGLCLALATGTHLGSAANKSPVKKPEQPSITKLDDTPLALADPAATLALDWNRLAAGQATVSVLNKSAADLSVSAPPLVMSCDPPCPPLTIDVSPAKTSIGSYQTFVFKLNPRTKAEPGSYGGVFTLNDDAKKTAPFRQAAWLKPQVLKLARTIYRAAPCGKCFSSGAAVPVPLAPANGQTPLAGALRSDAGNIVFAYWQQRNGGVDLIFDEPPAAGNYTGEIPWGPASAKTALAVTVLASDLIVWPLLVILLGTSLAFLVKRYLGVSRITLDLRRRDAELGELWQDNRRQFLASARQQPFSTYSLNTDVAHKRKQIGAALAAIDRQWLQSSLDEKDAGYQQALSNVTALQTAIAAWPDFAPALRKLAEALQQALATVKLGDLIPSGQTQAAAPFALDAQQVLVGSDITVEEFATRSARVAADTSMAVNWMAAYKVVKNTSGRYRTLQSGDVNGQLKPALAQIEPSLITAWKRMFEVSSQAAIDAILAPNSDLDVAEVKVREIEDTLATTPSLVRMATANFALAVGAEPVNRNQDLGPETAARPNPIDDRARAKILRERIRRGDTLSFLFAILIAILTGLNSYYFSQPFGTLKDYVGLFLWAAATKAVLDILGAVLDKFAPLRALTGRA